MDIIKSYIDSGILEMYVLGMTSVEETLDVTQMALLHDEIRAEIDEIKKALDIDATKHGAPSAAVKAFLLATIDYAERIKNGEPVDFPPILSNNSKVSDFEKWTSRPDMILPDDFDEICGKIIGYTPEATTLIAWIKTMAPFEIHEKEYERFLILEGSCDITIADTIYHLTPGDYMQIPLFKGHSLVVTSSSPCKFILQRVAA